MKSSLGTTKPRSATAKGPAPIIRKALRGMCPKHPEVYCTLIAQDKTYVCHRCASHELGKDLDVLNKHREDWSDKVFKERKQEFARLYEKIGETNKNLEKSPAQRKLVASAGGSKTRTNTLSKSPSRGEKVTLKDAISALKEKKKEVDLAMYAYRAKREQMLDEVRQRSARVSNMGSVHNAYDRGTSSAIPVHRVGGAPTNIKVQIAEEVDVDRSFFALNLDRPSEVEKKWQRIQLYERADLEDYDTNKEHLEKDDLIMDEDTRELLLICMSNFLFLEQDVKDNFKMNHLLKAFEREEFTGGEIVIAEGESGSKLYILEQGEVEIYIDQTKIRDMDRGAIFGELALLYDAPRSATVRCKPGTGKIVLWSLTRRIFKQIQIDSSTAVQTRRMRCLLNSPDLGSLGAVEISRLVSSFQMVEIRADTKLYAMNDIVSQCVIIDRGFLSIYAYDALANSSLKDIDKALGIIRPPGAPKYVFEENARYANTLIADAVRRGFSSPHIPSKHVCDVMEGCILGIEILRGKAGLPNSWRWLEGADKACGVPVPFTAVASSDVNYLMFTVDTFERLLGPAQVVLSSSGATKMKAQAQAEEEAVRLQHDVKFDVTKFSIKHILGNGSFGYVVLAEYTETAINRSSLKLSSKNSMSSLQDTSSLKTTAYALKLFGKTEISRSGQLEQLLNEKRILSVLNSPFILRLYGTAQSTNHLFIVTELVDCGDLWGLIYTHNPNPNHSLPGDLILFYTASIVLGLTHMHDKGFAHRDIKPENVMIDQRGYPRIIDLGFAKAIPYTTPLSGGDVMLHAKSFTLCGTPEYLAPEVIAHAGHDHSVDLWALGILIYEMYMIRTPFKAASHHNVKEIFTKITKMKKTGLSANKGFEAYDLVKALVQYEPWKRLGISQGSTSTILHHPFFTDFDIPSLEQRVMVPSYIPDVVIGQESAKKLPPVIAYRGTQDIFDEF